MILQCRMLVVVTGAEQTHIEVSDGSVRETRFHTMHEDADVIIVL